MKKIPMSAASMSLLFWVISKDYYITGNANPIFCAVGLR